VQSTHVVQQNDVMVHGTNNTLIRLSDKRGMNLDLILTKIICVFTISVGILPVIFYGTKIGLLVRTYA